MGLEGQVERQRRKDMGAAGAESIGEVWGGHSAEKKIIWRVEMRILARCLTHMSVCFCTVIRPGPDLQYESTHLSMVYQRSGTTTYRIGLTDRCGTERIGSSAGVLCFICLELVLGFAAEEKQAIVNISSGACIRSFTANKFPGQITCHVC